jgi:Family of unknown function (DUF5946)
MTASRDAPTLIQHLVDSYAVQHAANPDRRNRQSVAVHLMSLCASLEQGVPGTRLRHTIGTWTGREYPLLVPRPDSYQLTVRDLADTPGQDRPGLVSHMARSAWAAWSAHHDQIRAWLAAATARTRPPAVSCVMVMLDGPLCTLECAQRAIGYERRAPCVQVRPANRAKRPSEGPADT